MYKRNLHCPHFDVIIIDFNFKVVAKSPSNKYWSANFWNHLYPNLVSPQNGKSLLGSRPSHIWRNIMYIYMYNFQIGKLIPTFISWWHCHLKPPTPMIYCRKMAYQFQVWSLWQWLEKLLFRMLPPKIFEKIRCAAPQNLQIPYLSCFIGHLI